MGRCSRRGPSLSIHRTTFLWLIKTIAFRNSIQVVPSSLNSLREAAAPALSLRLPVSQLIGQQGISTYPMDSQNERVGSYRNSMQAAFFSWHGARQAAVLASS